MQSANVSLTNKAIGLHGLKVEGVESRPANVEAREFRACADIIDAGLQLVNPTIKTEVLKYHQLGQRCFIHVKIEKTEKGYIPISSVVVLLENGTALCAKDARFKSYLNSYDLKFAIPIYIESINTSGFHAGIILQPWLNVNDFIKN